MRASDGVFYNKRTHTHSIDVDVSKFTSHLLHTHTHTHDLIGDLFCFNFQKWLWNENEMKKKWRRKIGIRGNDAVSMSRVYIYVEGLMFGDKSFLKRLETVDFYQFQFVLCSCIFDNRILNIYTYTHTHKSTNENNVMQSKWIDDSLDDIGKSNCSSTSHQILWHSESKIQCDKHIQSLFLCLCTINLSIKLFVLITFDELSPSKISTPIGYCIHQFSIKIQH